MRHCGQECKILNAEHQTETAARGKSRRSYRRGNDNSFDSHSHKADKGVQAEKAAVDTTAQTLLSCTRKEDKIAGIKRNEL